MRRLRGLLLVVLCWPALATLPVPVAGQSPPQRTQKQIDSLYHEHIDDFDYLLGDWEFTSVHREFGEGRGYWSAVRLAQGQIVDEYRIVGDEGETFYLTTTLRAYNAVLDRWELVGMHAGDGIQDMGTARRVGDEVHIEQRFGVLGGKPDVWRIRYYDIRPDAFSWRADRSPDGGSTWEADYMRIEARRIGPARELGAIAPARPPK